MRPHLRFPSRESGFQPRLTPLLRGSANESCEGLEGFCARSCGQMVIRQAIRRPWHRTLALRRSTRHRSVHRDRQPARNHNSLCRHHLRPHRRRISARGSRCTRRCHQPEPTVRRWRAATIQHPRSKSTNRCRAPQPPPRPRSGRSHLGAIGISMIISVLERQSEIGLRRSLGAKRRHIVIQFVAESALLSLVGGLAGIAVAPPPPSSLQNSKAGRLRSHGTKC